MTQERRIIKNAARCGRCKDVIISCFRHDFVECSCGATFVDGGKAYLRRGWTEPWGMEELSEYVEE